MENKQSSFLEEVYKITKKIPKGKVATYGQIAKLMGKPKNSRLVGFALHRNPTPYIIPCHRVVNRDGKLSKSFAFGGEESQKHLLIQENVLINDNKVDLKKYKWQI